MKSTLAAYLVSQIAFTASIRRALSSLAGSSLILCALPALGAEAVFSQDGTKVFTTRGMVIDLSAGTISKFVIPGLGQGRIRDLERAGSGEILAVTGSGLIWWDGADGIKLVTGPRLKEDAAMDADKRKAAYWKPRVFAMPGSRSPFVRIAHGGQSHIFWIGFSDDWDEAPDRAAGVYSKVVDEGWEAAIRSNYRLDI